MSDLFTIARLEQALLSPPYYWTLSDYRMYEFGPEYADTQHGVEKASAFLGRSQDIEYNLERIESEEDFRDFLKNFELQLVPYQDFIHCTCTTPTVRTMLGLPQHHQSTNPYLEARVEAIMPHTMGRMLRYFDRSVPWYSEPDCLKEAVARINAVLADSELNGWVRDRFTWLLPGSTTLTELALRSNRFWVPLVVGLVTLAEGSMGHPACTFQSKIDCDSFVWSLQSMPIFDLLVHDPARPLHERIAHWQTQVAPSIFQEVSKLYDWLGVPLECRDPQPTPEQQTRLLDQLIQRADHGDKVLREKLLAAAPLVVQLNSLKEILCPHQLALPNAKPSLT